MGPKSGPAPCADTRICSLRSVKTKARCDMRSFSSGSINPADRLHITAAILNFDKEMAAILFDEIFLWDLNSIFMQKFCLSSE